MGQDPRFPIQSVYLDLNAWNCPILEAVLFYCEISPHGFEVIYRLVVTSIALISRKDDLQMTYALEMKDAIEWNVQNFLEHVFLLNRRLELGAFGPDVCYSSSRTMSNMV